MLISWNTTRQCNLRCRHCYRDATEAAEPNELTTDEGRKLIAEIAACGFKVLVLSGGEPLLRADICDLVAATRDAGLRPVLGTNGTLLTAEAARLLKAAGAARVGISLDSAHAPVHDDLRLVQGAFDQALAGIAHCRQAGLPFQIHTTVTSQNYAEIEQIAHKAVELGAAAYHIFFLVHTGRAKTMAEEDLRVGQYERLLRNIMRLQQALPIELKPTCAPQFMRIARQMGVKMRFSKGCLAGLAYGCVLPNGDVHPCPYLPMRVGNVRETPFTKIWRQDPLLLRLRHERPEGRCGVCQYQAICGGCRARAYAYTGNYMAEEPWCPYQPQVVQERKG